jgi:hypothetical protein
MRTSRGRALVVRASILLIAGSIVVLAASPVLATGPSQAVIKGPGLQSPVSLRAPGEPTIGPALATMVQESGFFAALHGADAAWRHQSPEGKLGPRYVVTYTLGGSDDSRSIVQYVYPYASAGPVTYMPPGQRTWANDKTTGGWHRADASLKEMLIGVGLPQTPPITRKETSGNKSATDAPTVTYFAVAILIILCAVVTRWLLRRAILHAC